MLLNKVFRRSPAELFLLLEAFLLLGWIRLILLTIPFRSIAGRLKRGRDARDPEGETSETLAQIGWAVRSAARWTPWDSKCFAQALAARGMLDRRRIPSVIYLGMKRKADGKLAAHAWLRAGGVILTGEAGHEEYTVLSAFGAVQNSSSNPSLQ